MRKLYLFGLSLVIGTMVLAVLPAAAQLNARHAKWTATLVPLDARAGEGAQVVVTGTIDPTWHIYAPNNPKDTQVPTTVKLTKQTTALKAVGPVVQPEPERVMDPGFKKEVQEYRDAVALGLPVTISPRASARQKAVVEVNYQACDPSRCLPPVTETLELSFKVAPGTARANRLKPVTAIPAQPNAPPPPPPHDDDKGLLAFVLVAIAAGFAALLTPCVFPMIPITVSFFIKKREGDRSGIAGPIAYCAGIISTFTCVGVLSALIFGAGAIQRFANHGITNIVLAILFLVMAANLFGVFEIVLPSSLVNRAAAGSQRAGFVGPFLMGLTFALTSFTCTVAFVGTLLVTASKGTLLYPIVGMLAFSTAFSLPFFLLALFPQYLARMPKSGSWLTSVKAFMGFLEIAAALKFLSNADLVWQQAWLTRPVFLAIWAGVFVVAGLYLIGWLRLPHDAEGMKIGWGRRTLGAATAIAGLFCLAGVRGASLGSQLDPYVPPDPYPGQAHLSGAGVAFQPKYSWATAIAKIEGKPIFINFTGVNCTNCRQMEQFVLPRKDVATELAHFVPVELYTDRATPEDEQNKKLEETLRGVVTLPLYAVVTPEGKLVQSFDKGYTRNPQEFVQFLREAQKRYAAIHPAAVSATEIATR